MGHLITAALLSALAITATGWANDPVITTAATVICVLLINPAGGEIIMDWRGK